MIKRIRSGDNFTVVNNDFLRDKTLSWKAKGLLTYLMSLPEDWKIGLDDLSDRSKDMKGATRSAMTELIDASYATRVIQRNNDGTLSGYEYFVSDIKKGWEQPSCSFPTTDNPTSENRTLLNTNNTKNYNNNKKGEIEKNCPQTLFEIEKKAFFSETPLSTFENFQKKLAEADAAGVDVSYYFAAVRDWAEDMKEKEDKRAKRTINGWVRTAHQFMRSDKANKRLVMKEDKQQQDDEMLRFLKL